jgi:plastocyanin
MESGSQAAGGEPHRDIGAARFGWRRLQMLAAIAAIASFVVPMVIDLSLEPFFLAMAAPFVVGLLLGLKWPRVAAIWLGVISLAILLVSIPFLGEAMTHPESVRDFIPTSVFILSSVVGAAAAIPSFRESSRVSVRSGTPRRIAVALIGLMVAASAWSMVAYAGLDNAVPQEGDILLTAEDFAFTPVAITAERGTVSIAVTNHDNTRHTLTMTDLGVDLNIPPGTTQRVTFTADQGTYTFFCRPHPDMEGQLEAR